MRKSLMSCSLLKVSFDVGVSVEEDFTSIVRDSSSMISSRMLLAGAATVMVLAFFDVGVLALTTGFAGFLELRVESPSIDLFSFIVYNYIIMGTKLTKKQLAVLDFLRDFTEENGYSPSYREIMAGLSLTSVSAVAEHIENLVAKGALKKVPGAARSLEILDYKHEETVELFKVRMLDASEEEKTILLKAAEILGLDLD